MIQTHLISGKGNLIYTKTVLLKNEALINEWLAT